VYSLDDDVIDTLVPGPVHAVILLFPDTEDILAMRGAEKCMKAEHRDIIWIPQVDVGECLTAVRLTLISCSCTPCEGLSH